MIANIIEYQSGIAPSRSPCSGAGVFGWLGRNSVLLILGSVAMFSTIAAAQSLDGLPYDDRYAIEQACQRAGANTANGYQACINRELALLQRVATPDLSAVAADELFVLRQSCFDIQTRSGGAAYRTCINSELDALRSVPTVDLSTLSSIDRNAIQLGCSPVERIPSAADYRRCVNREIRARGLQTQTPSLRPDTSASTSTATSFAEITNRNPAPNQPRPEQPGNRLNIAVTGSETGTSAPDTRLTINPPVVSSAPIISEAGQISPGGSATSAEQTITPATETAPAPLPQPGVINRPRDQAFEQTSLNPPTNPATVTESVEGSAIEGEENSSLPNSPPQQTAESHFGSGQTTIPATEAATTPLPQPRIINRPQAQALDQATLDHPVNPITEPESVKDNNSFSLLKSLSKSFSVGWLVYLLPLLALALLFQLARRRRSSRQSQDRQQPATRAARTAATQATRLHLQTGQAPLHIPDPLFDEPDTFEDNPHPFSELDETHALPAADMKHPSALYDSERSTGVDNGASDTQRRPAQSPFDTLTQFASDEERIDFATEFLLYWNSHADGNFDDSVTEALLNSDALDIHGQIKKLVLTDNERSFNDTLRTLSSLCSAEQMEQLLNLFIALLVKDEITPRQAHFFRLFADVSGVGAGGLASKMAFINAPVSDNGLTTDGWMPGREASDTRAASESVHMHTKLTDRNLQRLSRKFDPALFTQLSSKAKRLLQRHAGRQRQAFNEQLES